MEGWTSSHFLLQKETLVTTFVRGTVSLEACCVICIHQTPRYIGFYVPNHGNKVE